MNKLKAAVLYEYSTKLKAMCIFYIIQYLIVALIFGMIALCTGNINQIGSNVLEVSTVVFVSIMGVLGYKEDFKALIQNGYTRKSIFFATICTFVFMTGTMALIDTIIGNLLHYFLDGYFTLFGSIYGYKNIFANWLWLTTLYLIFCSLFYLGVLIINKVGKMMSLYLGVGLGGIILLIIALFRFVLSDQIVSSISTFLIKSMGFVGNGSINYMFPILTFFVIGAVLGIGSYYVIRRTELR